MTLGVVAVVLLSIHGAGAGTSPAAMPPASSVSATNLLAEARDATTRRDPTCSPSLGTITPVVLPGPPPRSMLSAFGVFRSPATSDVRRDPLTPLHGRNSGYAHGVYSRYIRRALDRDGYAFYLVPAANVTGPVTPLRCYGEQIADYRRLAAKLGPSKRRADVAFGVRFLDNQRRQDAHPVGICLFATGGASSGDFGCQTIGVDRHPSLGQLKGPPFTLTVDLVPDGVATVTARYPVRRGGRTTTAHATTVRVVNNLAVFKADGGWDPPTVIWHAADGSVVTPRPGGWQ